MQKNKVAGASKAPALFIFLGWGKNFLDDFASYDLKDLLDATPQEKAARR